ncbi:MAG: RNA methyltransferase [Bacteroidota bacterium]|nr:RNA methyltransferase [Bacteroidota bacterium]
MSSKLPTEFITQLQKQPGVDVDAFLKSLEQPPPVSLRINPMKRINDFDDCDKIPWATGGVYLPERISFTMDPLFHAGCYYVQEASSMSLEQALRQIIDGDQPLKVLDLCAAPGGKTTHMLSTLPQGSFVVSNEVIGSRNNILQQNVSKWGYSNVVVTQNDVKDFSRLAGFFDIVVVDAPCSGEGLFRKQPDAVEEWSLDAVAVCVTRQSNILDAVYDSIKEGGFLIYSTCTFETSENEAQCTRMIQQYKMQPVALPFLSEGIVQSPMGMRFYPHRIKGEGFFISVLQKTDTPPSVNFKNKTHAPAGDTGFLAANIQNATDFITYKKKDELYAFPKQHSQDIQLVMDRFFVRKAGVHLGTVKGKDLVPSHELALSNELHSGIQKMELSRDQAIAYLRCETVSLTNIRSGWAVVTYKGFALGWIKGIGNRINNYFPRNLRILKSA